MQAITAVCDPCAEACRWSEHTAVMQWLRGTERAGRIESIAEEVEIGNEEAIREDGEGSEHEAGVSSGTLVPAGRECESAGRRGDGNGNGNGNGKGAAGTES